MAFSGLDIYETLGIILIIISELVSCTHHGQRPVLHAEIPALWSVKST